MRKLTRLAGSVPTNQKVLVFCLAFAVGASAAQAAEIYTTTDPGGWLGFYGPDVSASQSVGVRFTPNGDYTFDSAGLWFMNNAAIGVHPLVRVTLRPDNASVPGQSTPANAIIEEMFLTVTTNGWDPVIETVVSTLHPRLCAGQNYWVVAESNAPGGDDGVWVMAGESSGFSTTTNQGHWQAGGMGGVPATRVFGTPLIRGDVDGDGAANGRDVQRFVRAILGTPHSPGDLARADMNCDGLVNAQDVPAFVNALLN